MRNVRQAAVPPPILSASRGTRTVLLGVSILLILQTNSNNIEHSLFTDLKSKQGANLLNYMGTHVKYADSQTSPRLPVPPPASGERREAGRLNGASASRGSGSPVARNLHPIVRPSSAGAPNASHRGQQTTPGENRSAVRLPSPVHVGASGDIAEPQQ